jgi:hypothetical protein
LVWESVGLQNPQVLAQFFIIIALKYVNLYIKENNIPIAKIKDVLPTSQTHA